MKDYVDFLQETCDELGVKRLGFDLTTLTEIAAKKYAKQCCEDTRKRCYENAEIDYCSLPDFGCLISESSIIDTEIILP